MLWAASLSAILVELIVGLCTLLLCVQLVPLLSHQNDNIVRETLALLVALLYGPCRPAQVSRYHWCHCRLSCLNIAAEHDGPQGSSFVPG